ncbi:MAG: trimeric intracellular cation channel family protein [Candidatus Mucispirillum faecigallinarum]|nr:trimeric intracellular cation channel family protein [Candidatus Mucispirillum faecigallinarum]
MSVLYFFDLFGTFAFAVSGALLGVKKDMDIYGMFVLAISVGVGGGTMRDMMLGRTPPFVLTDINYMFVIAAATLLVFFLNSIMEKSLPMKTLNIADAVGLGVFTSIGANVALSCNVEWYGIIFFGVMTATAGGMIRDTLAGEVPFVLKKEVYASASIIGGIIFIILYKAGAGLNMNILVTSVIVTLIRILAIYKDWHLPHFRGAGK